MIQMVLVLRYWSELDRVTAPDETMFHNWFFANVHHYVAAWRDMATIADDPQTTVKRREIHEKVKR